MKKTSIIPALLILTTLVSAQSTLPRHDAKVDSAAIVETSLNYIEGYYQADEKRMAKALDAELVKRIIFKDSVGDAVQTMGYTQLLLNTRRNKNSNVLVNNEAFKATVTIYDIGNNVATVKITTNKLKFMDYLQLGRINGEWKIVNVLWEFIAR